MNKMQKWILRSILWEMFFFLEMRYHFKIVRNKLQNKFLALPHVKSTFLNIFKSKVKFLMTRRYSVQLKGGNKRIFSILHTNLFEQKLMQNWSALFSPPYWADLRSIGSTWWWAPGRPCRRHRTASRYPGSPGRPGTRGHALEQYSILY